jgi:putative FmdB family regulatory protein
MPLHEYLCRTCGHRFEKLVSIAKADAKQPCPQCGGRDSEKLISAFSARASSSLPAGGPGGGGFS